MKEGRNKSYLCGREAGRMFLFWKRTGKKKDLGGVQEKERGGYEDCARDKKVS